MSRQLSYTDAAKILGGGQSKLFAALDKIVGGLLLGSMVGVPDILGWFGAKGEFVKITRDLVGNLAVRRVGSTRLDRTDQLRAAHAALALAAFVDEVSRLDLPFDVSELQLNKRDAVLLGQGNVILERRSRAFAEDLLSTTVPMPNPIDTHENFADEMTAFYERAAKRLLDLLEGFAIWDRLNETQRKFVTVSLRKLAPNSLERYDEYFLLLAGEFPEVACWANLTSHSATQHEVAKIRVSLGRIEEILQFRSEGVREEVWESIARSNRAALARPILETADVPDGLVFPNLITSYIDPSYRVARSSPNAIISHEGWWSKVETRHDLAELLIGNLLTPEAISAPILVLGHPGSGKSVLTRVLAARLPPDQFIAVRVPLRNVPADADLQEQIESAIRLATGVTISWPLLAGSTGGALPVVLLDGFDELLQATGVSQTDYLLRIADFQRRETDQGRAVAFVVTSRVTVADRARIPRDTLVLRLESFSSAQTEQWVQIWNQCNDEYFRSRAIEPFTARCAQAYKELSAQPLLLLMLAIYDADANGLQRDGLHRMSEAQLYEQLLLRFAYREITKPGLGNSEAELSASVEDELTQLSIIALAMFNRGAQSASEQEIEHDLSTLLGRRTEPTARDDFRAPLGQAERALGRFFFVQRSVANRAGRELATYEFLHATFAEYLVTRLIWRELQHLRLQLELESHASLGRGALEDSNLFKFLSYSALCVRASILKFITEFSRSSLSEERAGIMRTILAAFSNGIARDTDPPSGGYTPRATNPVRRRATYSVNLVLLSVLVSEEVKVGQLFPHANDPVSDWRRHTLLWQSQLKEEEWNSLVRSVEVFQVPLSPKRSRDAFIHSGNAFVRRTSSKRNSFDSLSWSLNEGANITERSTHWTSDFSPVEMRRSASFLCNPASDYAMHALGPAFEALGDFVAFFTQAPGGVDEAVETRFLLRDVLDVLLALPEKGLEARTLAYRRLTDVMTSLQHIGDKSPIWLSTTFARLQVLYYGVLGSDGQMTPRLLLELTPPPPVHSSVAPHLALCMIRMLGRDHETDAELLYRLSALFDRGEMDEDLTVEAWIFLRELGYLNSADWAWTDASIMACKGVESERLAARRPDLAKRLIFVAGRDAPDKTAS